MSDIAAVSQLLDARLDGKTLPAEAVPAPSSERKESPQPGSRPDPPVKDAPKADATTSSRAGGRSRSRSRERKSSEKKKRSRSRSPRRRGGRGGRGRRSRSRSRSRDRSRRRRRRTRSRSRSRSRSPSRSPSRSSRRGKTSPAQDPDGFVKIAETAEEKVVRDQIRDACTVLVTMLPVRATARDIATYFSQCGTVHDVRLVKDRAARVSKGFAYVEMETVEQATACLRLTGALFQGRSLVVQPTQNERNRAEEAKKAMMAALNPAGSAGAGGGGGGGNNSRIPLKVYVGSLHPNVTDEALRAVFSPFGAVTECVVSREPNVGTSRGFGFVTFASAMDAKRAIADLNGLELLGRPIKVGESKNNPATGIELPAMETEDLAMGDRLDNDDSLTLNSHTRALLMAKLQRGGAADASMPIVDQIQQSGVHIPPSRCVVLQHCFDTAREDATPNNETWERDIETDVRAECAKFGTVEHCKLERDSGCIYVKFADIGNAVTAKGALDGRFFGGQTISVDFVTIAVYERKYGR